MPPFLERESQLYLHTLNVLSCIEFMWNKLLKWLKRKAIVRRVSVKKVLFLKISENSQESTCARVSFLIKLLASAYNFILKKTLAQVLSCEFRKIFLFLQNSSSGWFSKWFMILQATYHLSILADLNPFYATGLSLYPMKPSEN